MKQIVKYEVFLSNEKTFIKTKPAHVFERFFSVDDNTSSDDVFKMKCDFRWKVRNFVNGCRELFTQVYVNETLVTVDYDFDL